jgi:23S rRNA pseudouridine1911/1915/1917 synthase
MEELVICAKEDEGKRVDSLLSEKLEGLSRSGAQALLEAGRAVLQSGPVKKNYRIRGNEVFSVLLSAPEQTDILPENIPLEIVYEDRDVIVINKPRGMVVHPAPGNWTGTLVNALLYHCGNSLSGINGELRPGIVHRLDKDTSGLLVAAKHDRAHQSLAKQLFDHTAGRMYEAVVYGAISQDEGVIDRPIARHKTDRKKMAIDQNGRRAVTHYRVLERYRGYTYLAFRLETGRTHQIRVHIASMGHPILGDLVYGPKKDLWKLGGQCLNASKLQFEHPTTGKHMEFSVPLPNYFTAVLQTLRDREENYGKI